ncbi:MAG TPA: hypothetical protein VLF14_07170 [Candidatus Binatia bacterium]|nr:hypothetical protein [Candidatus Binatia bacterium]
MKLKRLEEVAEAALKSDQKAAARLAQAERGCKAATVRASAAEASLRRARRELKQAKKAARAAQKDARKASKKLSKARKKAKRKAQEPAPPSEVRKSTAGKKAASRDRTSRSAATLSTTAEDAENVAPPTPEAPVQ